MALYTSGRDASFLRGIHKELIADVIDTEVAYYKLAIDNIKTNVYGESRDGLIFFDPILIPSLITREDQSYNEEDHGQDYTQTINFAFVRQMLFDKNIVPQVGDIIEYNLEYWEVDNLINNQYWGGKNPETSYAGKNFGYDVSIILNAHLTRKTRIDGLVQWDYFVGLNPDD